MQAKSVLLSVLVLTAFPALAGDVEIPLSARSGLSLSVYASGNALVQEQRRAELPQGVSKVTLQEVSPALNPATAWLEGRGIDVRSLDFLFDILTPQSLLNRSLGKTVGVVRTNPATGAVTTEQATVLSVKGGVVLKIGDRIETGMPERLVFGQMPDGLRAEPAIQAQILAPKAGSYDLDFAYQTGGLGWKAVYSVLLEEKGERLELDGVAVLTNASGMRFKDAKVSLFAGEMRRVSERAPVAFDEAGGMQPRVYAAAKMAAPQAAPTEEDFSTGRAYLLADPVTLENNQTKQVKLLREEGVKSSRDYVLAYGFDPASVRFDAAQPHESRPEITLSFDVPKERAALPQGIARIYQQDKGGQLRLVGEDRVKGAAAGERVKLVMGGAYDIAAKWRQTEYAMQSKPNVFEGDVAWEVELQNARKEEVTVRLTQPMSGQWSILDSSHPHKKSSAREAEWQIRIPSEGRTVLKVKAHFKN